MKLNVPLLVAIMIVVGAIAWFGGRAWLDASDAAVRKAVAVAAARDGLTNPPDGSEALKRARAGLDEFPDDPELLMIQGIALNRRGRFTDAEAALERALQGTTDPTVRDEAEYYVAVARCSRYVETKERADWNLSQAILERAVADPSRAGLAHALLGRALTVAGASQDPAAALKHVEAALAAPAGADPIDRAKLTALAEQLRSQLGS